MWKQCKRCGRHKALYFFTKAKSCRFGVRATCKKCVNTEEREYYQKHSKAIAKTSKQWQKDHPERTKEIAFKSYCNQKGTEKYRARKRDFWKIQIKNLSTLYIKQVLCSGMDIRRKDITPEMIEAKREQLML